MVDTDWMPGRKSLTRAGLCRAVQGMLYFAPSAGAEFSTLGVEHELK